MRKRDKDLAGDGWGQVLTNLTVATMAAAYDSSDHMTDDDSGAESH